MENIIKILKKYRLLLFGILTGGFTGYLYWHFVGCLDGTCPLTMSPVINIIRGSLLGGLLFSFIESIRNKETNQ